MPCKKGMVSKMAKIRVTLTKSLIGRKDDHIASANALGLKKVRDVVEHEDIASIRGMVNKISYMVDVEEI